MQSAAPTRATPTRRKESPAPDDARDGANGNEVGGASTGDGTAHAASSSSCRNSGALVSSADVDVGADDASAAVDGDPEDDDLELVRLFRSWRSERRSSRSSRGLATPANRRSERATGGLEEAEEM